jgi:hypothetical protein
MRVQLSLFPWDLDTPVTSEHALEGGIVPESADNLTILSSVITVEPPAEDTTLLTNVMDNHTADETVSSLFQCTDREEEEQRPDTLLSAVAPVISPEQQFDLIFKAHWTNSQDLAYCMINIALPQGEEYLFDDFTTYVRVPLLFLESVVWAL